MILYFKGRELEREGSLPPAGAFTKAPLPAGVRPNQRQELGTPSGFPLWVARIQVLGPSFAAFPGISAGSWIWNIVKRLELAPWYGIPVSQGRTNLNGTIRAPKFTFMSMLGRILEIKTCYFSVLTSSTVFLFVTSATHGHLLSKNVK